MARKRTSPGYQILEFSDTFMKDAQFDLGNYSITFGCQTSDHRIFSKTITVRSIWFVRDFLATEILKQVKSLESGKSDIHNPISVSLDLKMLKESSNQEERSLADVVEAISDLRLAVDKKLNSWDGLASSKIMEDMKGN